MSEKRPAYCGLCPYWLKNLYKGICVLAEKGCGKFNISCFVDYSEPTEPVLKWLDYIRRLDPSKAREAFLEFKKDPTMDPPTQ